MSRARGRAAVFLDRDGTLVAERGYVTAPGQLRLLAGAAGAVRALRSSGYLAVLVTNQSAVARGLLDEEGLALVHGELRRRLARRGAELDGLFVCPHHPTEGRPPLRRRCSCRKPAPGLLRRAIRELQLDPRRSWCVGDSQRDVDAAARAGVRAILVRTGHGRREEKAVVRRHPRTPVVADLAAAARVILGGAPVKRPQRARS